MYPRVIGEFETVKAVAKGRSIARFGDGELKCMEGVGYIRQPVPPIELSSELCEVAKNPADGCLIGIPTMDPEGPKYPNWLKHQQRFVKYFNGGTGVKYYSAFITRPDSAPWIECREYYSAIQKIWDKAKRVAIVSEDRSKLLPYFRAVSQVTHIPCLRHDAWSQVRDLERQILRAKPDLAVLSCGVTATVLANRLTGRGLQAVDLGSMGSFLMRLASA